jgi:hypothetical protein
MELCKKIEDLTCKNCIYCNTDIEEGVSEPNYYCYYNYIEPEDCSDRWVPDTFFCHDGEWAAKVKVEESEYENGKKVRSNFTECVKVANRQNMVCCFLNDGVFDWF